MCALTRLSSPLRLVRTTLEPKGQRENGSCLRAELLERESDIAFGSHEKLKKEVPEKVVDTERGGIRIQLRGRSFAGPPRAGTA